MSDFDNLLEEFEKTPVKTTQAGKKLTTTACVNEIVNGIMGVIAQTSGDVIVEQMMPKIQEKIEKEIGVIPPRVVVEYQGQQKMVQGATHEKFELVLDYVVNDVPVYMTGKAGTGKNVICKQVAEALGLDFYFTNCVTQEYKLTGFIDANGNYHETQFYQAFTKGGLFFLDEMDASIPETLVTLNGAISNRYFDFPCGKVYAHPDFRVIAAGNTFGKGADINYSGRYCLDGASLDRFAVIEIDYSPAIEKAIAGDDNELLNFVHSFRAATEKANVECICSYRTIERVSKLKSVVKNLSDVLKSSLIKGMDKDSLTVVISNMDDGSMSTNAYFKALKKI
ncbi:MAG: AAA family ATPase [Bacteroidales bacterium]|nr:AAA family ATPase [Bacteroidales bacterium]